MRFFFLFSICIRVMVFETQAQTGFTIDPVYCGLQTVSLSANSGTLSNPTFTWSVVPNTAMFLSPNAPGTNVTFMALGNFTVTLSIQSGSSTSQFVQVTNVAANPTISISQSSPTTCIVSNFPKYSKPVILNASGAQSYLWFPYTPTIIPCGNCTQTTVRPSTSTCYTAIGASSGCTAMAISCVTVIPQFTLSVTPMSSTICAGEKILLTSGNIGSGAAGPIASYTYSWSALNAFLILSSELTPTVLAFPNVTTTFTTVVTDANSCVSLPATSTVYVNECVGIREIENKSFRAVVYPNPTNDLLNIKLEGNSFSKITLYDALGLKKELLEFAPLENMVMDVITLPPGIYFLELHAVNGLTQRIRFVREE